MKTTDVMPITARPRGVAVAALFAVGVALIAVSGGVLARDTRSESAMPSTAARIQGQGASTQDWGFVLRADTAQVLRHRPGLEPASFVRSHAFGWTGPTMREVLHDPALVRELRLQPNLSPIDVMRLEARAR